jgi:hypothetical protein
VVMRSSAFCTPISRGSRCVPAPPEGCRSSTSGRPTFAERAATR